jgi:hypothetical protein
VDNICVYDSSFVQKPDAINVLGFSIKICIIILKVYMYDVGANVTNEYCKVNKNITMKSMNQLMETIRVNFLSSYL